MKKKRFYKILALVFACCILTGCGKSNVETKERKEAEDSDYESVTVNKNAAAIRNLISATDHTVKLNIWVAEEDQQLTRSMVADFQSTFPEISFDISVGFESEETVKDTILENIDETADIYTFADDQLKELVQAGALAQIEDYYTYNPQRTNVAAAVEAASYDGQLYAYPMTADNGYFLLYDSSVISPQDAASMESLLAAAKKENKKVGMHIANGWYLYSFFRGAGYSVKENDDGSNQCDWNAEGGAEVAETIAGLLADGVLVNMDDATMTDGILNGSLAAVVNGTWRVSDAMDAWGDNFAAAKLPTFRLKGKDVQMASFSGCKLVGVNPRCKDIKWAMVLAEYLTGEQNQVRRFEARGLGPSNTIAQSSEDVKSDPAIAALAAQSEFATVQRVGNSYWEASQKLGEALVGGTREQEEIQKLLDEAVEKMAGVE